MYLHHLHRMSRWSSRWFRAEKRLCFGRCVFSFFCVCVCVSLCVCVCFTVLVVGFGAKYLSFPGVESCLVLLRVCILGLLGLRCWGIELRSSGISVKQGFQAGDPRFNLGASDQGFSGYVTSEILHRGASPCRPVCLCVCTCVRTYLCMYCVYVQYVCMDVYACMCVHPVGTCPCTRFARARTGTKINVPGQCVVFLTKLACLCKCQGPRMRSGFATCPAGGSNCGSLGRVKVTSLMRMSPVWL